MTAAQTGALTATVAAAGYTLGAVFLKSALVRGAKASQVNVFVNLSLAILMQPLWLFVDPARPDCPLWQPLLHAAVFFAGQICAFAALSRGDVSVATPLLGAKVVIVTALNAVIFGLPISLRWWVAALICSAGVALIAYQPRKAPGRTIGTTVLWSLSAATLYSITDIFAQHWAGSGDPVAYLAVSAAGTGVLSIIYYAVSDRQAFRPSPAARGTLFIGAGIVGVQAGLFFLALVWANDATVPNIMYALRSVGSVAVAWAGGWMLGLKDRESGPVVMSRRLMGAGLLFMAIVLVLL